MGNGLSDPVVEPEPYAGGTKIAAGQMALRRPSYGVVPRGRISLAAIGEEVFEHGREDLVRGAVVLIRERVLFIDAESIVIDKTPEEIYRFWRNLENLPRFMSQHVAVDRLAGDQRSRWTVKSFAGQTFEWDSEIINDIPNELLAWRSLQGADLDHAGSVHFEASATGGTKVSVILEYRPPVGNLGAGVARLFGQEPSQVVNKDLNRLKQLLETGDVSAREDQTRGVGGSS